MQQRGGTGFTCVYHAFRSSAFSLHLGPLLIPISSVGFLGIGIMGYAMASNLLKAGYEVTVWNRSPGKTEGLAAAGAKVRCRLPRLPRLQLPLLQPLRHALASLFGFPSEYLPL